MKSEDIQTVLVELGVPRHKIKQSNDWVAAPCPFAPWTHGSGRDRRASFGVSIDPNGNSGYNCLSCGAKGRLSSLPEDLSTYSGKDYSHVSEFIDEREISVAYPPWETADVSSSQPILHRRNEEDFNDIFLPAYKKRVPVEYCMSRGISRKFMRKYDLRWDSFRRRVLFKVIREGKFYGAAGRAVDSWREPKIRIYSHQKSLFLLGEEHIQPDASRPLVVIEGLMGLGELNSRNLFDYADAVCIQGSKLSEAQRDRLVELDRYLVIAMDNDKAGWEGCKRAEKMLDGLADFHTFQWPKKVNEFQDLSSRKIHQLVTKPLVF